MMADDQWLAEYRSEGRDWQFAHYILGQRLRITGAVIARDVIAPAAVPLLDWMERKLTRG